MAERILLNELKALQNEPWVNIQLFNDNIFSWDVALIPMNKESLYYGSYLKAKMTFPRNYPYSPPSFTFMRALFHPNVYPGSDSAFEENYKKGQLCISILHAPGEDEMSGELAAERWTPAQRVETVLISIMSLLDDPNPDSSLNVDAGKLLHKQENGTPKSPSRLEKDMEEYKKNVAKDVELSKRDIPDDFVMPGQEEIKQKEVEAEDDAFWYDSDADGGFSDTDDEQDDDEMNDATSQSDEDEEDADDDEEPEVDEDGDTQVTDADEPPTPKQKRAP